MDHAGILPAGEGTYDGSVPDVGNWDADDKVPQEEENRAITASVAACINACDGYFLFDMIHLKKADQWSYVKTGIDGVIKKD